MIFDYSSHQVNSMRSAVFRCIFYERFTFSERFTSAWGLASVINMLSNVSSGSLAASFAMR